MTAACSPIDELVLRPSDPPASRSDTLTIDRVFPAYQSGVPARRFGDCGKGADERQAGCRGGRVGLDLAHRRRTARQPKVVRKQALAESAANQQRDFLRRLYRPSVARTA